MSLYLSIFNFDLYFKFLFLKIIQILFRVTKCLLNPNQKIYENLWYSNWKKILRLLLITSIFTSIGVALVVPLTAQLNSSYQYLKNSIECMEYDQNDYTVTSLSGASETVVSWYWYLQGQAAMKSNSLSTLWSRYLSEISNAWKYQFVVPIILVMLNYFFQFGYWAFKKFYRFSSTRTENIVIWFQIYISMIFFNIMLPLIVFSSQYTEPKREFYLITGPMYSIFFIFTTGLLQLFQFNFRMLFY